MGRADGFEGKSCLRKSRISSCVERDREPLDFAHGETQLEELVNYTQTWPRGSSAAGIPTRGDRTHGGYPTSAGRDRPPAVSRR
jgi:hypothetical protein